MKKQSIEKLNRMEDENNDSIKLQKYIMSVTELIEFIFILYFIFNCFEEIRLIFIVKSKI